MLDIISKYFIDLRQECINKFEEFEPSAKFERKPWQKEDLGSGEIGVIRGDVFEKAAVNYSFVQGKNFPMQDGEGPFIATGVSLITHMKNPHMPTVHFNVRYIELKDRYWIGGGFDLTPMGFEKKEDTEFFHQVAKEYLDQLDPSLYPLFFEEAKKYFFIPHWKQERGVGGIFFDHFSTNIEKDFKLIQLVSTSFLKAILPIYERRKNTPYSLEDKIKQNQYRARYAEFNLIYDRGTKFGLVSGGNPEAIFCSLLPSAAW